MRAPKGQNFLYQPNWQQRVADAVVPSGAQLDALAEIGGGPGGLTRLLAPRARRFWVIESDRALALGLRNQFGSPVLEDDVLTVDFSALAPGEPLVVAGNLPYYITSPILLHLFQHAGAIREAVVMMQREVAERVVARPGGRAFGLLSATAQFYARPQRLFDLPPGAFRPPPQVHSTLMRLEFAPRAAELGVEAAPFMRFLRLAFAEKRKQLGPRLGLPITARAEQLSLEQLAEVYHQARAQREF
jgi:16S rRNA (adenine1518-N6/adenine1519-N6)-dimethyltransferase